jgi:hypothetical protein
LSPYILLSEETVKLHSITLSWDKFHPLTIRNPYHQPVPE